MRDFYKQVHIDVKTMRFSAKCPICGKPEFGSRLPFICRSERNLIRLEKGESGIIKQLAYNKSHALAVQDLARLFNLCRSCGGWVCDKCFCENEGGGICVNCASRKKTDKNETEENV